MVFRSASSPRLTRSCHPFSSSPPSVVNRVVTAPARARMIVFGSRFTGHHRPGLVGVSSSGTGSNTGGSAAILAVSLSSARTCLLCR